MLRETIETIEARKETPRESPKEYRLRKISESSDEIVGGFSGGGKLTEERFKQHLELAEKMSRKWL